MSAHVRPSELARFWELHPRTVYTWIKEGRLAAVRTPGDQFRVRVEDVLAFCEKENRPPPPFLAAAPPPAVYVIGASAALRRALQRSMRSTKGAVVWFDDAHVGLFAAVITPPRALVLGASPSRFDAEAVTRALRATSPTASVPLLFFDVATSAQCAALVRAGATSAVPKSRRQDLAREVSSLLAKPASTSHDRG